MSREILFKAKSTPKKSGEFDNVWVYGDLIHSGGKYYIHPKGNLVSATGELGKIIVMHEVIPETICQYTGLTDKNGNKIWENDVVKCQSIIGRIGWNETHMAYTILASVDGNMQYYYIDESLSSDIEAIGNIFDNPELLKGE